MENMRKKACVFLVHGMSGGTATLSYRIGQEYMSRGYSIFYICSEMNSMDNYRLFSQAGFNVRVMKKIRWKSYVKKNIEANTELLMLSYSYELFRYAEIIEKNYCSSKSFLYVVHERTLYRGGEKKTWLTDLFNKINHYYIKTIEENGRLLFMEGAIAEKSEIMLNMKFERCKGNICPLPYIFPNRINLAKKNKIISTMARIDFPFKAYLLGLVDILNRILDEGVDVELWIIGDGPSMRELRNKVDQMSDDKKDKVKLVGSLAYDEAKAMISNTYVFVGMGTGIIDAVSTGVPAIVVKPFINECMGKGFFSEHPDILGYMSDDKDVSNITDTLKEILGMSEEKYNTLCSLEYESAKDYYSFDKMYKLITSIEIKSKGHSLFEVLGYKMNAFLGYAYLLIKQH